VVIELDEGIGRHDRLPKNAPPCLQVVRIDIGQRLEESQGHHEFAYTAHILLPVATMFRIARMVRIGEVEHGNPVTLGVITQQVNHLTCERHIRSGKVDIGISQKP
jgi:hypothetical protein